MEEKLQKTKTTCRILAIIILIISIAFLFFPVFVFEKQEDFFGAKISITAEFSVWQLATMDENIDLTYDIKDLEIDDEKLDNDIISMVQLLGVEEEIKFLGFYVISVLLIAILVGVYGLGVLWSVITNEVKPKIIEYYLFTYSIFILIMLFAVGEVSEINTLDYKYTYFTLLFITIIVLKCMLESKFKKQQTISVRILADRYKSEDLSWYKLFAADIYTFVDNANLNIDNSSLTQLIQVKDRKEFKEAN